MSVVTDSEGLVTLKPMAESLMKRLYYKSLYHALLHHRYIDTGHPQPHLLYTDRDCCSNRGISRFLQLFAEWEQLEAYQTGIY